MKSEWNSPLCSTFIEHFRARALTADEGGCRLPFALKWVSLVSAVSNRISFAGRCSGFLVASFVSTAHPQTPLPAAGPHASLGPEPTSPNSFFTSAPTWLSANSVPYPDGVYEIARRRDSFSPRRRRSVLTFYFLIDCRKQCSLASPAHRSIWQPAGLAYRCCRPAHRVAAQEAD